MKSLDFTPFTEEQFQKFAWYKARAYAWPDIAQYLQLPVESLERVAWTHEEQWDHTLAKAEDIVAHDTLAEVVNTLRKDMRLAEPKLRPTIANSLTRVIKLQRDLAPKKRRKARRKRPPVPTPTPDPVPVAEPVPVVVPPPVPVVVPPPAPTVDKPEASPGVLANLKGAVASFLGLVLLLWTMFSASARANEPRPCDHVEVVVTEGVVSVVLVSESPAPAAVNDIDGTLPWWLERPGWSHKT